MITPGQCKVDHALAHPPAGPDRRRLPFGHAQLRGGLQLVTLGLGQSTCIGIGGDPVNGVDFVTCLRAFEEDPATDAVVMIGEIGGPQELEAARFAAANMRKPVAAFVAGSSAPLDAHGHAGAVVSGESDTAVAKMDAIEALGLLVARNPAEIGRTVKRGRSPSGRTSARSRWPSDHHDRTRCRRGRRRLLGLGIVRSLGRRGSPVRVVDDERLIARFSRFVDASVRVPDLRDEQRTVETLFRARRGGRTSRLGAVSDAGGDGCGDRPEPRASRPCLPRPYAGLGDRRWAWDKRNTYRLAEELESRRLEPGGQSPSRTR